MTAAVFCETKPQLVVRNVPVPSNRSWLCTCGWPQQYVRDLYALTANGTTTTTYRVSGRASRLERSAMLDLSSTCCWERENPRLGVQQRTWVDLPIFLLDKSSFLIGISCQLRILLCYLNFLLNCTRKLIDIGEYEWGLVIVLFTHIFLCLLFNWPIF